MARLVKGEVVRVPQDKPFGFVKAEGISADVFVHKSQMPDRVRPEEGQELEFEIVQTDKGLNASNVRFVKKPQPNEGRPAPYTFVPVGIKKANDGIGYATAESLPISGHDGVETSNRLSGQLCFTLTNHTPLLVGNRHFKQNGKNVVTPWRLASGDRQVVLAGSSLKGMIRHYLSGLLNAPMERVGEQYFSYRPNADAAAGNSKIRRRPIVVRLRDGSYEAAIIKERDLQAHYSSSASAMLELPRGVDGDGILEQIFEKSNQDVKRKTKFIAEDKLNRSFEKSFPIPEHIIKAYQKTQVELGDELLGHLSSRHPEVKNPESSGGRDSVERRQSKLRQARQNLKEAANYAFLQPKYLLYAEFVFDNSNKPITMISFGHHFRYRWGYRDTVRLLNRIDENPFTRPELAMQWDEGVWEDDNALHAKLTGARALFGYAKDARLHDADRFSGSYDRLAGRIAVNHAVEFTEQRSEDDRFLTHGSSKLIPLKELGSPKPSAVEFYVQQDPRLNSLGLLVTYGDQVESPQRDYEGREVSQLAGRKFYRHQPAAASDDAIYMASDADRESERAPLAVDVNKSGSRFRFSVRFQDLTRFELGALLFVLAIQHAKDFQAKKKPPKEFVENPSYALKLGYARPLGWGSVTFALNAVGLFNYSYEQNGSVEENAERCLNSVDDTSGWRQRLVEEFLEKVRQNEGLSSALETCLDAWQYAGSSSALYPSEGGEVFAFHSRLRFAHAKNRRKPNGGQSLAAETVLVDPAFGFIENENPNADAESTIPSGQQLNDE